MSRPCDHPTGPPQPEVCRVCWLYVNREDYRKLYDSQDDSHKAMEARRAKAGICRFRERMPRNPDGTIPMVACRECGGKLLTLFHCRLGVNGGLVTVRHCNVCPKKEL